MGWAGGEVEKGGATAGTGEQNADRQHPERVDIRRLSVATAPALPPSNPSSPKPPCARVQVLRPIAERLAGMPADEKQRFTWDDVRPSLNAVHLGHISRLYGESGPQLLELLTKNPAVAVPVILTRLQAKEQEWCVRAACSAPPLPPAIHTR